MSDLKSERKDESRFTQSVTLSRLLSENKRNSVYAAESAGGSVCLKVLRPKWHASTGPIADQQRAAMSTVLKLQDHENIMKVLHAADSVSFVGTDGASATTHVMTMELCRANLDELVQHGGPLPHDAARAVFLRLVSAVEHAHTMGITHADLKPSQVLFAQDGSVRVSDFDAGSVYSDGSAARCSSRIGSQGFMAPEVFACWQYCEDHKSQPQSGTKSGAGDSKSDGKAAAADSAEAAAAGGSFSGSPYAHIAVPESLAYDPYAVDAWGCGLVLLGAALGPRPAFTAPLNQQAGCARFQAVLRGDFERFWQLYDDGRRLPAAPAVGADSKVSSAASERKADSKASLSADDRDLRDLLQGLLQPDPAKRLSLAAALKHAWLRPGSGRILAGAALSALLAKRCDALEAERLRWERAVWQTAEYARELFGVAAGSPGSGDSTGSVPEGKREPVERSLRLDALRAHMRRRLLASSAPLSSEDALLALDALAADVVGSSHAASSAAGSAGKAAGDGKQQQHDSAAGAAAYIDDSDPGVERAVALVVRQALLKPAAVDASSSGDGKAGDTGSDAKSGAPAAAEADSSSVRSLLDIGCGTGALTVRVASALRVPLSAVHGVDVVARAPRYPFAFATYDGRSLAAFADGSLDCVIALKTLHHVRAEELRALLRESARVLRKGDSKGTGQRPGVFALQEHDCDGEQTRATLDLVHRMWKAINRRRKRAASTGATSATATSTTAATSVAAAAGKVADKAADKPTPLSVSEYRSREDWVRLFADCGLIERASTATPQHPTRTFYAAFVPR